MCENSKDGEIFILSKNKRDNSDRIKLNVSQIRIQSGDIFFTNLIFQQSDGEKKIKSIELEYQETY